MNTSQNGKEDITGYEGVKYIGYLDTGGVPTAGVGHTGPDVEVGVKYTKTQVEQWLTEDLKDAEDAVNRLVKVALTQGQFDALVSFVFNLGETQFRKSTLLRKLNSGNYVGAKNEFKRWIYDDGRIQPGLVKRRYGEIARFDS